MTFEPIAAHWPSSWLADRRQRPAGRPGGPGAEPARTPPGRCPRPDGRPTCAPWPAGSSRRPARQGLPAELNATAAGAARILGLPWPR